MSSDADAAAVAVFLFNVYSVGKCCSVAASVVFIHDAFVTFGREVACFWNAAERSGASFLFFANKWISMTNYVVDLVRYASLASDERLVSPSGSRGIQERCSVVTYVIQTIQILQLVPPAIFSALRAYVLSRNKPLGVLILALSLAPVGANLAVYGYHMSGERSPPFGCTSTDYTTDAINLRLTVISRVPLITADMLLIYITWSKLGTRDTLRDTIRQSKRMSLSDILFRNGTIYFVVLFILNVLHLVFTLTTLAIQNGAGTSYITIFTSPLTAILISRFLLDLQEASQAVVRLDPNDPLHSSRDPYDAPSFISSLGAFINPDAPAGSDPDLDWHDMSSADGDEQPGTQATESPAAGPSFFSPTAPLSSPTAGPSSSPA